MLHKNYIHGYIKIDTKKYIIGGKMKDKFYDTNYDEQESIINIDYCKKQFYLYTSRKAVYDRIVKKLGNPTNKYYTNKKISSASWIIPFTDKKSITTILSRPILIGNMK